MKSSLICKFFILFVFLAFFPFVLSSPKALNGKELRQSENDVRIVVLNYHKVDETNIALSVSPKDFDDQMAYLKAEGYQSITPEQLAANLRRDAPLPEKPLLITFDDGYLDNYANAYPILKKYGFTAIFFVITDYMNRYPNYMTWDQLREMNRDGFKIGSHTMQHKSMTELSDDELRAELVGSKEALDYQLGTQAQYLAYPTGTYSLHIAQLVSECGYDAAFTIKYGGVNQASNPYALERVPVFRSKNTFRNFIDRLRYLPIFERCGWMKI